MAENTAPTEAAAAPPDPDRLYAAVRDARDEAAPFALLAAGILVVLALVSGIESVGLKAIELVSDT